MRIVDQQTFLALPMGTVFSVYQTGICGPLCIKRSHPSGDDDYTYQTLNRSLQRQGDETRLALFVRLERGDEIPFDPNDWEQNGLYGHPAQRFVVWSATDVRELRAVLKQSLPECWEPSRLELEHPDPLMPPADPTGARPQ